MKQQNVSLVKYVSIPSKAQSASYQAAYRTAQCRKPHMTGENLILPSATDMVTTMLRESTKKQLLNIPLSDDTVCHRNCRYCRRS
jgi:hypothetical protein